MTNPQVPSGSSLPGVAVIGTGCWGKNLVRVHHQPGALSLLCDKDRKRILMVSHLLQRHPVFVELKRFAAAGGLERIGEQPSGSEQHRP
jgi:hypothetical protein